MCPSDRSSHLLLAYACRGSAYIRNVFADDLEGKLVRDHVFMDISSWNQCPPAMTRNVFAYDLEGELVRDHVFIDIFSWNQCPPAIAHLRMSYATVFVMIVRLFVCVKPATGNLLLSGSMWVHVGSVMHCKCVSIVVT